jgi:hypothetical protein
MTHDQTKRTFQPDELQRALERFDWLVEQVRDEVHQSDVLELQGVLTAPDARTSAREHALVVLGLLGTAEAVAALRWFDPTDHHRRVRLCHRLAKRECTRRRRSQSPRDARQAA